MSVSILGKECPKKVNLLARFVIIDNARIFCNKYNIRRKMESIVL